MDWYPWHPARYREKTLHLTAEQDGIYRRLIDHYMETRKPLPDNDLALARISGVDIACFEHASSIIRAFFKQRKAGFLNHQTCDEMLNEQDDKAKFRTERARIAAEKRWSNQDVTESSNANIMPDAMLGDATVNSNSKHIGTNVPINPLPPKAKTVSSSPTGEKPDSDFLEFYHIYPHKVGKDAAQKAYHRALKAKGVTHAVLIDGAERLAAAHAAAGTEKRFIPHPATWLNGGRWKDDLSGITQRRNATQPAANARGSQFNAVMAAAAELIEESGGNLDNGQSGLPQWGMDAPPGLPDPDRARSALPEPFDRSDPASGPTIDHDDVDAAHG